MLRLRLLGPFAAEAEGEKLKLPALPRSVPLWAYLLLNSAVPVRRELLAQLLWPDDGEELGRAKLRRHLHQLQLALPPAPTALPWLLTTPTTIQWNPASDYWLDTDEFERLCQLPDRLEAAIALYRGELLAGWYDDWLFPERERLLSLYLVALDQMVEQRRIRLDYPAAIGYAHELLAHDLFNEAGLRQLLRLHYELGDRASALREYDRFNVRLSTELGIEPMAETRMLHEAILHHRALPGADTTNSLPTTAAAGLIMLPLVGREQELAQLEQVWAEAARGKGGLALVAGEAGIGKSRLTAELANKAERGGARVLHGGSSYAEPTPYQALVTALRPTLPLLAALDSVAPLRAVLPLLPELAHRRTDLTALPPIDPQHEQQRLYQGLADCLVELAAPRPLLFILEDLHWAGAATLELLRYLAERIGNKRLLIVGTYREEEVARQHPLCELRRMAVQAGRDHYVPLMRLDEAAVAELARQVPDLVGGDEAVAAQLYAQSEGNPFFLSELIRVRREQRSTEQAERRLPGGVASLIGARVARLAPNPRLLAEVAAVGGVGFNLELLAEVTGWDEGSLLGTLDELLDQGLVREAGGMQGYDYSFSHHLVQEAIYAQMSMEVRSRRHRRHALVIEELYPQRLEETASELARHFDLGSVAERAVPYYLQAARQALAVYADEEALAAAACAYELSADQRVQFEALALCEDVYHKQGKRDIQQATLAQMTALGDELGDMDMICEALRRSIALHSILGEREREAELIAELDTRCAASGSRQWQAVALHTRANYLVLVSQYNEARTVLEQAIAICQELDSRDLLVECYSLLAMCATYQGQFSETQQIIERIRQLSPPNNQRALALTIKANIDTNRLQHKSDDVAYKLGMELLDLSRTMMDREMEATAHRSLGSVIGTPKQVQLRLEHLRQAREIHIAMGQRRSLASTLINSAVLHDMLGDYEQAMVLLEQARVIMGELDDVRSMIICDINLSDAAHMQGEYAKAKAIAERGLQLAKENTPAYELESTLIANLGMAEVALGEFSAGISHLQACIMIHRDERSRFQAGTLAMLAVAYLRNGDLVAAGQAVKEALEVYQLYQGQVKGAEEVLWAAAQVGRMSGDRQEAQQYLASAYTIVADKAADLPDDQSRRAYLSNYYNRDLVAAYEQDRWPAYAQPTKQGTNEVATREMPICPTCQQANSVIKSGMRRSGTQRYRCQHCQRYFTSQPKPRGYAPELRQRVIALHQSGAGVRAIARELGVNPQTVSNWLATASSPPEEA